MTLRSIFLLLTALLAPLSPAGAQTFDQADRAAFQSILETRPTGVPATLPSSGRTMTVTRTETAPRICRDYRIGEGESGVEGTACRLGAERWEIVGAIPAAEPAVEPPAPTPATATAPIAIPLPERKPFATPAAPEAPAFPIPPPKPERSSLDFPLPARKPAAT